MKKLFTVLFLLLLFSGFSGFSGCTDERQTQVEMTVSVDSVEMKTLSAYAYIISGKNEQEQRVVMTVGLDTDFWSIPSTRNLITVVCDVFWLDVSNQFGDCRNPLLLDTRDK